VAGLIAQTGELGLDSRQEQKSFFPLYRSEQLAFYPMSSSDSFPRGKWPRAVKPITHLHIVQRLRMRGTVTPTLHIFSW
jgi:hypothetical protein